MLGRGVCVWCLAGKWCRPPHLATLPLSSFHLRINLPPHTYHHLPPCFGWEISCLHCVTAIMSLQKSCQTFYKCRSIIIVSGQSASATFFMNQKLSNILIDIDHILICILENSVLENKSLRSSKNFTKDEIFSSRVYMIICFLPLNWSLPALTFCPIILSQSSSGVRKSFPPNHFKVDQFLPLTFLWTQLSIMCIKNSLRFKLCHSQKYSCICILLHIPHK